MLRKHRFATTVGAFGAAIVVGHAVLGPAVVPVQGALVGVLLLAAAGLWLLAAGRMRRRAQRRRPREAGGASRRDRQQLR